MKIGSQQLSDKVTAKWLIELQIWKYESWHILQGRDENIAQANDLEAKDEWNEKGRTMNPRRTFSCLMCFKSFNSRYVLLLKTGVLKGFMIFFTATDAPVNWSFAELCKKCISYEAEASKTEITRQVQRHLPRNISIKTGRNRQVGFTHSHWLQVDVTCCNLAIGHTLLLIMSKQNN